MLSVSSKVGKNSNKVSSCCCKKKKEKTLAPAIFSQLGAFFTYMSDRHGYARVDSYTCDTKVI